MSWAWYVQVNRGTGRGFEMIVTSGRDDLTAAIADAVKAAMYYVGVCGYEAQYVVTECCDRCRGFGRVLSKRHAARVVSEARSRRVKTCPRCRGREGRRIGPVPLLVHEQVELRERPRGLDRLADDPVAISGTVDAMIERGVLS